MSSAPPPDLLAAFANTPSPFALVDREFSFVWANRAYLDLTDRPASTLIGRVIFEVFPEDPTRPTGEPIETLRSSLERVVATHEPHTLPVLRYDVEDAPRESYEERYWSVTSSAVVNETGDVTGVLLHAEDISGFTDTALREVASGNRPVRAGTAAAVEGVLGHSVDRLRALADLASALVGVTSPEALAIALCGVGAAGLGAESANLIVDDQKTTRQASVSSRDGESTVEWKPHAPLDQDLAPTPVVVENPNGTDVALALNAEGTTVGQLVLTYPSDYVLTSTDRFSFDLVASLGSEAITACLLHVEQTDTLDSVGEAILVSSIEDPVHADVHGLYRPATVHTASGGDWFDQLQLDDHRVLLVIGDVAGHGPVATGEMGRAKATIQAHAIENHPTDVIATKTSAAMHRLGGTPATAVIAMYVPSTGMLSWTTAGHPFPLLIPRLGVPKFLEGTHGPPLGTGLPVVYAQSHCALEKGDVVVLYTDGLIERPGELIDVGLERIRVAAKMGRDSAHLAEDLYEQLVLDQANADDVAILVARIG